MKNEKKVGLWISDTFGWMHNVNALPKKKIIEKIEDAKANIEEHVKQAWKHRIHGLDTYVRLDLETAKVHYVNYSPNWDLFFFDPSIILFRINRDIRADISSEDLYTPDELEEIQQMMYKGEVEDHEGYAKRKGIDLDVRYVEYLVPCIAEEVAEHYNSLMDEVNRLYSVVRC